MKIYLVDGSGYIFRAYYAVRHLSNSEGFPTNALFGFVKMLLKLLSEVGESPVVMVFDAGRETFRNELYSEYKANRDECPEDLKKQMPYFRELSAAFGLPILEVPGYEADDIIGTLSERCAKMKSDTVIISGDKDLMQLVNEHVSIWDTMKDRHFDAGGVKEKLGVMPDQVIDYLGITGDSSDNIPGLKGAGPKTAVQLIENYKNIEGVISSVEQIREDKSIRSRKKIADQIELDPEMLRLSRKLVEIVKDVPVSLSISGDTDLLREGSLKEDSVRESEVHTMSDTDFFQAIGRKPIDQVQLGALLETLEFSSLLEEFGMNGSAGSAEQQERREKYHTILQENYADWLEKFRAVSKFTFDLETTSLEPYDAEIVGVAICWNTEEAFYIPFAHKENPESQISRDQFFADTKDIFANPDCKKSGQNLKYDISILEVHGIEISGIESDSMLAAYLLNPDSASFSLDALSKKYLGITPVAYKDIVAKDQDFRDVPIVEATAYAAEDAHLAFLLIGELEPELEKLSLKELYSGIEILLVPVLSQIELNGIRIDHDFLGKMSQDLEARLKDLSTSIYEQTGKECNLNSPKQLSEVLFDHMGIPTKGIKKTKTGGYSTNSTVLEKLSAEYEVANLLLDYRMYHKLKSTYVDALPKQVHPKTGRLHTKFHQAGTGTGRLSSSDPNLQNIPIQTKEGRKIRKAFIAEEGKKILAADYSQVELRILAHMSGDEALIRAFEEDLDIHAQTAREILNIPEGEDVQSAERRIGKTINFGVLYGMSGFRLARDLGLPVQVANQYIENYFDRYAKVKDLFHAFEKNAEEKGYVETFYGRKRFLNEINVSGRAYGFLQRAAVNAPIQGGAADLMKLAMIVLDQEIAEKRFPMKMILQIHDELLFEVDEAFGEEAVKYVQKTMESVAELAVPLKVDAGYGDNWDEAHS